MPRRCGWLLHAACKRQTAASAATAAAAPPRSTAGAVRCVPHLAPLDQARDRGVRLGADHHQIQPLPLGHPAAAQGVGCSLAVQRASGAAETSPPRAGPRGAKGCSGHRWPPASSQPGAHRMARLVSMTSESLSGSGNSTRTCGQPQREGARRWPQCTTGGGELLPASPKTQEPRHAASEQRSAALASGALISSFLSGRSRCGPWSFWRRR